MRREAAPPPGQLGPLRDASRENILREIDASLKRLRTDWVDVLLVHWPDARHPVRGDMRALDEVVVSGRARFVGVSNFTGAMLAECMGTRRVDVSQVGSHARPAPGAGDLPVLVTPTASGCMGYGSLGHGLLTGAFTAATTFDHARDWRAGGVAFGQPIFRGDNFKTNVGVVERLRREVAEPRGVPLSQIALAWVLANPRSAPRWWARAPPPRWTQRRRRRAHSVPAERATIDEILGGVAGRVRRVHAAAAGDGAVGRRDPGGRVGLRSFSMTAPAPDPPPISAGRKWAITLTVMVVAFMQILDTSVTNVVLPHLQGRCRRGSTRSRG